MLTVAGLDKALAVVAVPVHCVVLHRGPLGRVPQDAIDKQLAVLNNDCRPLQVRFSLSGAVQYYDCDSAQRPDWFSMKTSSAAERAAKKALGKAPQDHLNLYIAEPVDSSGKPLLGWATFPTSLEGDPDRDGVVLHYGTLPGGVLQQYNLGRTATHEVGHWLGLMHTFDGGCDGFGDEVADTPAHSEHADHNNNQVLDIFECWLEAPSCSSDARAPTKNFMNYAPDACMAEFTPGQAERVRVQMAVFRTRLLANMPAAEVDATKLRALNGVTEELRRAGVK